MKNMARLKMLGVLSMSAAAPLLVLQACSGDASGSDAGPDGTTTDAAPDVGGGDAANDVAPGNDSGCPTYTGSSQFCQAVIARCNTCGIGAVKLNTCNTTNFDAVCTFATDLFSSQLAAAESACDSVCDASANTACVDAIVKDAGLSTAQQKTVTDYCAHCSTGPGCGAQLAGQLVEFNDTLAQAIDSTCTPDSGGPDSGACGLGYQTCAGLILTNALKGNPCADAGGD
jgi:hypothetical protein